MTKLAFAAVAAALALSSPASAEALFVIGTREAPKAATPSRATLADRIERAVDQACPKPYFTDLSGREFNKTCRTEVREEIASKLANAPTTIALR